MKSLKVPYFLQKTDYTCGPASLQMVLAFYGIEATEEELATELETNSDIGTLHHNIIEGVKSRGLYTYVNDKGTINELRSLLDLKVPVVVRFIEPYDDEDHYSVVVGANRFFITVHDPSNGAKQYYTHRSFLRRWKCEMIGPDAQWLMAVSDKPLPIIDQQFHGDQAGELIPALVPITNE